jgi:hypothetical protein
MMKPRTLTTLVVFMAFILSAGTVVGEEAAGKTFGMQNGRFWNDLTDNDARTLFLIGIFEGWQLRVRTEDSVTGKVIDALSPCGSSFGELAEMVTTVYKEPENRTLPVGWVLMASVKIQCGQTTHDRVFPVLRKHLAAVLAAVSGTKGVPGSVLDPIDAILSVSTKQR